ncbi:PTST homolog 3, chloroplastic-like protein [Drosera capensis]
MAAAAFALFSSNLSRHHHHPLLLRFNHNNQRLWCRSPAAAITCAAASSRKPRKRVMSDAELRDGLREFVVSIGLPQGHVPSTKELNRHGRKDLANIVRRRGHKVVKDLLENSTSREEINHPCLKEGVTVEHYSSSAGQDKKVKHVTDSNGDVAMKVPRGDSATFDETDEAAGGSDQNFTFQELPVDLTLREKAQNFVKYGHLDENEGYLTSSSKANQTEGYPTSNGTLVDKVSIKHGEEDLQHISSNSNVNSVINGNAMTFGQSARPAPAKNQVRDSISSAKLPINTEDTETKPPGNQAEIDHLRFQLHQKEQELSLLKEQIEKEKEALSILQTQAENEIGKAEKLISEMDAELQSVEESLAGLKEVQIQYCGEGEIVEVAGSFNGWHPPIKMELDHTESWTCWLATLWLYPGVFEIKFIVDGQWKVDPQRESIFRGSFENNILRVDR